MNNDLSQENSPEARKQAEDANDKQPIDPNSKILEDVSPQNTSNQPCGCGNPTGTMPVPSSPSYVYAIGRIEVRFGNKSIDREFAQATGRAGTKGLTDLEALHSVLSQKENMYLVRQMCWVLIVEEVETYILVPRNSSDYDLLVETLSPPQKVKGIFDDMINVVIGVRGPLANPSMCNGLIAPIAMFDQIYYFDMESLIKTVPRPGNIAAKQFNSTIGELFKRIRLMAHNAGETDEHRALNYLSVRYERIYSHTAEMFNKNFSLSAIEVHPSSLSGVRKILDVVFVYTNRNTDVDEKYFTSVDVTEEFPFLVKKLSPYYDR
jgi:hypothetical protein